MQVKERARKSYYVVIVMISDRRKRLMSSLLREALERQARKAQKASEVIRCLLMRKDHTVGWLRWGLSALKQHSLRLDEGVGLGCLCWFRSEPRAVPDRGNVMFRGRIC